MEPTSEILSYETYVYVAALLVAECDKLEHEFKIASKYISSNNKHGKEEAYEIFQKKSAEVNKMIGELRAVIGYSYRNHPDKNMRNFWGYT